MTGVHLSRWTLFLGVPDRDDSFMVKDCSKLTLVG